MKNDIRQQKMTTSILALEILLEQGRPFLTKQTTEIGTIKYIYFSGYYQSLTTEAPI